MRSSWVVLLALAGCQGGAGVSEDTGTAVEDTGSSTEDTGSSEDTGAGPPPCESVAMPGRIEIPAGTPLLEGELVVDLLWVDLTVEGLGEGALLASQNLGAVAEGTTSFEFCLPDAAPSSDLYVIAPEDDATWLAASYQLRAWLDDGTDDLQVRWVSASVPDYLLYASDSPPPALVGIGIQPGWNWTTLDFAADQASSVPLAEASVELDAFLLPAVRDPLAGTVGPDLSGTGDLAIGALNLYPILNPEAPAPLQATVSGEAFTATGAGQSFAMQAPLVVPTEDHLYEIADLPLVRAGIFRPLVWIDGNGSLIYETGEAPMTGTDATLFYLDAADWRAMFYRGTGFVMGWNLIRNEQVVAWNDGLVLGGT